MIQPLSAGTIWKDCGVTESVIKSDAQLMIVQHYVTKSGNVSYDSPLQYSKK